MNKVAFITMDVESFYDTTCLKKKNITPDEKFDCAEEVKKFLDFLNKQGIKGTFFITVDFLPRCKEFIIDAIKEGHEIALHCLHHVQMNKMSDEEFKKSIKEAKEIIKKELGIEVRGNRFPQFISKKNQQLIIEESDFDYDSGSIKPNKKEFIKLNDLVYKSGDFYEFSLSRSPTFKLNISGGGFIRLIPWWVIKRKIKRFIKRRDAYLLYVHPFEIHEADLPLYNVNFFQKLFIKRGRDVYLDKIEQICGWLKEENYQFLTMNEYIMKYGRKN